MLPRPPLPRQRRSRRKPRCSRRRSRRKRRPRHRAIADTAPAAPDPSATARPAADRPRQRRAPPPAGRQAGGRKRPRRRGESRCLRQSLIDINGYRGGPRAFGGHRDGTCANRFIGHRRSGDGHDPAAAPLRGGHGRPGGTIERHGGNQCAGAIERARARDRRLGTKRQEPFRNPARSGRSRPHRCSHRCRSQRPGDLAFDGRKAGNAVDVAPGRAPAAARAG